MVTGVHEERTTGPNALLLQWKNGQQLVRSLSLPELGMVLIYEPALKDLTRRQTFVSPATTMARVVQLPRPDLRIHCSFEEGVLE